MTLDQVSMTLRKGKAGRLNTHRPTMRGTTQGRCDRGETYQVSQGRADMIYYSIDPQAKQICYCTTVMQGRKLPE